MQNTPNQTPSNHDTSRTNDSQPSASPSTTTDTAAGNQSSEKAVVQSPVADANVTEATRPTLRQIVAEEIDLHGGKFDATTVTQVAYRFFESRPSSQDEVTLKPKDAAIIRALFMKTRHARLEAIAMLAAEYGIQFDELTKELFDDLLNETAHKPMLEGFGLGTSAIPPQKRRSKLDRKRFYQEVIV